MTRQLNVDVRWDKESCTLYSIGPDITGLFVEADTLGEIVTVVEDMAPDLIEKNKVVSSGEDYEIVIRLHPDVHGCTTGPKIWVTPFPET